MELKDIKRQTQGNWYSALAYFGVPIEVLTGKATYCPHCGGHDRFTYDDKEGRGTHICRGCGAGDGISLACKVNGWSIPEFVEKASEYLGNPVKPISPPPPPPRKESRTADYGKQLWESASKDDHIVAGHTYSTDKAIHSACGAGRGRVTGSVVGKDEDCVITPSRTIGGALTGVECINAAGAKQFFGSKGMLILGNDLDPALPCLVFEGWASAVKWLDSRQWNAMAVVAFGKNRMEAVGLELEQHYGREVIIAEEVDQ